jgi:hypothetical protein
VINIDRITLLDGPSVLGDPSKWPGQNARLTIAMRTLQSLIDDGVVHPFDVEAHIGNSPPNC